MANYPMLISRKVNAIPEALSVYINQLVYDLRRKNRDIVALSLGESFLKYQASILKA